MNGCTATPRCFDLPAAEEEFRGVTAVGAGEAGNRQSAEKIHDDGVHGMLDIGLLLVRDSNRPPDARLRPNPKLFSEAAVQGYLGGNFARLIADQNVTIRKEYDGNKQSTPARRESAASKAKGARQV
jgi:hypothetical protein